MVEGGETGFESWEERNKGKEV